MATTHPRIEIVIGDITAQEVDAVVNAANSSLLGGEGVDGAIHRVGGTSIIEECRAIRAGAWPNGMPAGEAVATTAGDLPARWVIHTVGPVYSEIEDRSAVLASAYRRCLEVADELGARSVAFPAVSAGAYGWPMTDAARIAVETIAGATTVVEVVRFVVLRENSRQTFVDAVERIGHPFGT